MNSRQQAAQLAVPLGTTEEMADDLHLRLAAITSTLRVRSEESQSKFGILTFLFKREASLSALQSSSILDAKCQSLLVTRSFRQQS